MAYFPLPATKMYSKIMQDITRL